MLPEEEPATGDEGAGDGKGGDGGGKPKESKPDPKPAAEEVPADIEAIASQAENPDAVRNALMAERKKATEADERAREADAKVTESERAKLTEHERTKAELADAKTENATFKTENLRLRVAIEKKLPLSLAERLKGDTLKKMQDDADVLLEEIGRKEEKPSGDGDGGRGEGGGETTFDDEVRKQYANR